MNPTNLKAQADAARSRLYATIGGIADQRMQLLIPWWQEKFPTRQLRVLFGNNDYCVDIDDMPLDTIPDGQGRLYWKRVFIPQATLQPLLDALDDVVELTNSFRDGDPSHFTIEPVRAKGKP